MPRRLTKSSPSQLDKTSGTKTILRSARGDANEFEQLLSAQAHVGWCLRPSTEFWWDGLCLKQAEVTVASDQFDGLKQVSR